MTCEELKEMYELYAMGVSDEPESGEIASHLAEGCAACTTGVKHAVELVSIYGAMTPLVEPPARLRARIVASAGGVQQSNWFWSWSPLWGGAAASFAAVALYFGYQDVQRRHSLDDARAQISTLSRNHDKDQAALETVQSALNFLNEPETRLVTAGKQIELPPKARVFINAQRGVMMMASNLAQLPAGKTYQLWVIPKGKAPVPSGLFQSDAAGNALYIRSGAVNLEDTSAIAVSIEPESGSTAPTSTPIIVVGV